MPVDGRSSPESRLTSVDLPAPFGPMTACTALGASDKRDVVDGDQAAEAAAERGRGEHRLSHPVALGRAARATSARS